MWPFFKMLQPSNSNLMMFSTSLIILVGCASKHYACPDDNVGMFSDDPCYVESWYTYKSQVLEDLSTKISDVLPERSWNPTDPRSLYFQIEEDSGTRACSKNLFVNFSGFPIINDTVVSNDILIGGYRWARFPDPFAGQDCGQPIKQDNASAWITKVHERKIRDDLGPKNGTEILYRYQCKWSSSILRGELYYSSKMIHH